MSNTKLIMGRYGSAAGQIADVHIDAATHAFETIEYPHHKIHCNDSYAAHFDNTTTNDDDHRSCIGFTAPNTTKWIHLIIAVSATSPAEVFLEEAPTIDNDDGTEQMIYNRNRNSTDTSGALSLETAPQAGEVTTFLEAEMAAATFTPGLILEHIVLVGGEGPKAIGGVGRGAQEWVLDQGVKYLIRVQNIGANINLHHINLDWYEHTDKH